MILFIIVNSFKIKLMKTSSKTNKKKTIHRDFKSYDDVTFESRKSGMFELEPTRNFHPRPGKSGMFDLTPVERF